MKKKYLNETAKEIEHKNHESLKENGTIEYKQTRIEFCYDGQAYISPLI